MNALCVCGLSVPNLKLPASNFLRIAGLIFSYATIYYKYKDDYNKGLLEGASAQTSLLNKTVPSKVCAPLEFNKFINTSELLGQAKNMRLIKCHKFRELNTALQNIWAEQSVCTSLDENTLTRSVWLGSKNVRKGGGLNF